jgi:hypothetical protein
MKKKNSLIDTSELKDCEVTAKKNLILSLFEKKLIKETKVNLAVHDFNLNEVTNDEFFKAIGGIFKDKRKGLKLSIRTVSELLNIHSGCIIKFEQGKTKINILNLLSLMNLLNISLNISLNTSTLTDSINKVETVFEAENN